LEQDVHLIFPEQPLASDRVVGDAETLQTAEVPAPDQLNALTDENELEKPAS
jgi:hypothetical protein